MDWEGTETKGVKSDGWYESGSKVTLEGRLFERLEGRVDGYQVYVI